MGLFQSINTSASGLSVEKTRLDIISNNIANAKTTRTPEGGPFKKALAILRPKNEEMTFKSHFLPHALEPSIGNGVKVLKIVKDQTAGNMVYDPTHPDAYKYGPKKGFVEMSNVNIVKEMVNMIEASRSYEANITMINDSKQMFEKALNIGIRR